MIKRLPSRNQRSKGVRVKHILQICLLLGVCFWLIYQVKHSHDKKKEFDEKDAKASVKAQSDDEILKLGRKDLPQLQDAMKNEKHEEEEEDAVEEEENKPEEEQKEIRMHDEEDQEEANKHEEEEREDEGSRHEDEGQEETNKQQEEQEDEASKREEEEQEEETKNEETEDERRRVEDEETDEQDQERTEGEADREDEFLDEEKEREGDGDDKENEGEGDGKENDSERDDKESEGNRGEEKDSQVEKENSLDDHDNDGDRNAHVAREEHYKADDASSAVSHDNHITITETDRASLDNSNENSERNILQEEHKSNDTKKMNGNQDNMDLKLEEGEMAESGNLLIVTAAEEKDHGTKSDNLDNSLLLNARNNLTDTSNNSTGLSTKITVASLQSGTQTIVDSNEDQNATVDGTTNLATNLRTTGLEQANNPTTVSNGSQSDPNSTISIETMKANAASGDSFNNSKPVVSEKVISSNGTADGDVSSGSLVIKETIDSTQNETLNIGGESGETNEASHSSSKDGTRDGHSDRESSETNESMNGTVDATKEDTIDSSETSVIQDEKESQIDLDTLPDIRADVGNNEDIAAE